MTTTEHTHSREEIVAEIERVLHLRLGAGYDAATVLSLYRDGLLDGGPIADALILADLLPETDPIFAPTKAPAQR